MFRDASIKTKEFDFIVFDIESLFKPYETEEDNKKYIKEHVPFLICYLFVKWDAENK
jgi:hypothetical protein